MLNPRKMQPDELESFIDSGLSSSGEFFNANVSEGFDNSVPGIVYDATKELISSSTDKRASKEQAQENINAYYEKRDPKIVDPESPQLGQGKMSVDEWKKSEYRRDGVVFPENSSIERAKFLAESYDERKQREITLNNPDGLFSVRGAIGVFGQMVGSSPDPINLIPFGGSVGNGAKLGEKVLRASIEGAVGNIAVSAFTRPYYEDKGVESSWQDYVSDFFIGGAIGGGFGALGHGFSKLGKQDIPVSAQKPVADALDSSLDSIKTGEAVDLTKIPNIEEAHTTLWEIPEVKASQWRMDRFDELKAMGRSEDTIKHELSIIMANAEVSAKAMGISIDEYQSRYGAVFQASEVVGNGSAKRIVERPVGEVKIEVKKIVDAEIQNLRSEILEAEAGERLFVDGEFKAGTKSTFPQWFHDLGFTSKKEVMDAIDNKTRSYDKIKNYIEEKLSATDQEYRDLNGIGKSEIPLGEDGLPLFQREFNKKSKGEDRGAITLNNDGPSIIHIFEKADQSTIIHETGHLFLNNMERQSVIDGAPPHIKADFDTIKTWLGVESGGKIETKHHEKFARGFEQYLREGKAPRPELESVFSRFKEWLTSIYKSSKDLKVNLSDDARAVYSRLLGTEGRPKLEAPIEAPEIKSRYADAPEIKGDIDSVIARYEANPEMAKPEEIKAYQESIASFDRELADLEAVKTLFQSSKDTAALQEAAQKVGISNKEFDKIVNDFNNRLIKEDEARLSIEQIIQKRQDEINLQAAMFKRNSELALMARNEVVGDVYRILASGKATPLTALLSILEGDSSLRGVEGAGKSVDGAYNALARERSAKFFGELRKIDPKIEKLFESDVQFNENIALEIIKPGHTNDPMAKQVAEVFMKYKEDFRQRQNLAGADINKLEGHLDRFHDPEKLANNEDPWVNYMMEHLNHDRVFAGMDLNEVGKRAHLLEAFNALMTGEHGESIEIDVSQPLMRPPSNIAKKLGESRSLHFKTPEGEVNYLKTYGQGLNMLKTMAGSFESAARRTALMERLGPNPESTIAFTLEKLRKGIVEKKILKGADDLTVQKELEKLGNLQQFKSRDTKMGHAMMIVLGETNTTQGWFKKFSQTARAVNSLSMLGSALLSQPGDFVHAVNERRLMSDKNEAALWVEVIKDYASKRTPRELEVLENMGIYVDGMLYKNSNKFEIDNVNNRLSRANDLMFRYSGQDWHVRSSKEAAALSLGREMGRNIIKPWKDVHPGLKEMLVQYGGITEAKWALIQKAGIDDVKGKAFFHPGLIDKLDDSHFESLIPQEFQNITRKTDMGVEGAEIKADKKWEKGRSDEIKRQRQKLKLDVLTFFLEESRNAAPEPDAKIARIMAGGAKQGSNWHEAARLLSQFKTFAFVNYDRSIKGKRMMRDPSDIGGLGHHVVSVMALGYLSTVLKDIAKGDKPADPTAWSTWGRAAAQSGGLGIAGDFFSNAISSRSGADFGTSMAGPTATTLFNTANLVGQTLRAPLENTDGDKLALKWVDHTKKVLPAPFTSLWYTRAAMDMFVWNNVKEALDPGSVARSERRMKKNYNQKKMVDTRKFLL